MPNDKPSFASMKHDSIRELVLGHAGTLSLDDARKKLMTVLNRFTISRKVRSESTEDQIVLWILGFNITEADKGRGLAGRFVKLAIEEVNPGRYQIVPTVVDKPLKEHPLTNRPPRVLPNEGHPTMRAMLSKKIFDSKQDAIRLLDSLQSEFPRTIRGSEDHLRTLVFSRLDGKPLVQKWLLYIEDCEGGFMICGHVVMPHPVKGRLEEIAPSTRVDEYYPTNRSLITLILGDEYLD